jgi:hypothetical protein
MSNTSYKSKPVLPRHAGAKGERKYSSYSFLTLILDGVSGQRHALAALYPQGKDPWCPWIGGWVGLRAGLGTEAREKILCLCRGSNLVCCCNILFISFKILRVCYYYYWNKEFFPLNSTILQICIMYGCCAWSMNWIFKHYLHERCALNY